MVAEFTLGKWKVLPADNLIVAGEEKVKLEPKAMELLLVLAQQNGRVVSRNEIFEKVWKNQIVADHVLYNLIANLRKALQDDPQTPTYISTVPKKGYRLLQAVRWSNNSAKALKKVNRAKYLLPILLIVIVIIVIEVTSWLQFQSNDTALSAPSELPSANSQQLSIAVLPFDVFHANIDTQYFADGLAEEIIHQLTAVPKLTVIARTSSFSFRDKQIDAMSLAKKLNVEYLIEGSVRQEEQQLRITVQLIHAKQGNHVWSKVFTRQIKGILDLQQDISLSIVNSLLPDFGLISSGKLRQTPASEDAYLHFLRGSAMAAKATPQFQKEAILEFEKAIAIEPHYALAHVAIAVNTLVLLQHRYLSANLALERAQSAINKALEIAPNMAEAFAAQGLLYTYSYRYNLAEIAFKNALKLSPNLALAHHNYGFLLWIQDYQQEALSHFQIALKQNPMSAISNFAVADTLLNTGHLQQAQRQYQHCIVLLPDYPACRLGLANFFRFTSQPALVEEQMRAARKQLQADNIYLASAELINLYWSGAYQKALVDVQKKGNARSGGYLDLQLTTLIYMHNKQQEKWTNELQDFQQKWPDNYSIQLVLGLNAYLNQECEKALAYYEPILRQNYFLHGKFNVMAWGISHLSNMAYCYEQLEQPAKKQAMLNMLKQQIQTFELGENEVAGVELIKLKIRRLEHQNVDFKNHIITQTPVIKWLQSIDPVFQF